jgi:outer membrane protein OmpA-like peptidoglycan-associated protein
VLGTAAGGNDRRNAIIGAGIGAIAGAATGGYMDAQERKLREQLGSSGVGVTRTAQNEILLNMPADVTFDFNRADVKQEFRDSLYQLAQTLREYEATTIDVVGHADSVGDDAYNQSLSERRAASVAQVLTQSGVQPVRIVTAGYGESRPVASNETPDGRARNRRVEIRLQTVTS